MRWTRLFLYVLATILLLLGAGITFLWTLDLNDYKSSIEQLVVRGTGRSFTIDGRIDLHLGRHTSLTITNARFGNPDWATSETMARVERAHVVLDIPSLWSAGPIIIDRVELDNAELNIEKLKSGENNWTFAFIKKKSGNGPIALILRQAQVDDFALTVIVPNLNRPLEIRIDSLDQVQQSDGLFDAKAKGTLNGRTVDVAGTYGPLESLLTAKNLQVDIEGQFDTLSVTASGVVDRLVRPRRPSADIRITGPDIDHVTRMLGIADLGSGDLDLNILLQPDANDLDVAIVGRIGEHQIDSAGSVFDLVGFDQITMRVSIHGPDLSGFARLFGLPQVPTGPYRLSGAINRDGAQLDFDQVKLDIGAAKFRLDGELTQFPDLNGADVSLEVRGEEVGHFTRLFGLPGVMKGPFQIHGRLEINPEGLEVIRLDATTEIAELTVAGTISKESGLIGSRVNITGHGANIAAVAAAFDVPMSVASPFAFAGDIELGQNVLILARDATVTIDDNHLTASGVIGFGSGRYDTDLHARITGSDLAQVGRMAGVADGVPSVGYTASGRFQMGAEGYKINGLKAQIGDTKLTVDGFLSPEDHFIGTRIKVAVTGPEFGEFIADTDTMVFPDGPFDISGEIELLANAVSLKSIDLKLAGATGMVNADIGLPFAEANGTFDIIASGNSFSALLPDTGLWEPPDEAFEIRAEGKLDDGLLHLEPISIQLGDVQISALGVFDIPPDFSRTSLAIVARTENLAAIGTFDQRTLPNIDVNLDVQFAGTPQSFSLEDLVIKSGESDLTGSIIVRLDGEVPDVKLIMQSHLLDLTPLMEINPELDKATDDVGDEEEEEEGDGRLIPDWALPLEQLKTFNAAVDIDIAKFRGYRRKINNLFIDATVLDGRLEVERISGTTPYGSIVTKLRIQPTEDTAKVHVMIDGKKLFLGLAMDQPREEIDAIPKYDMSVNLDGSGLALRDIAASLNGQIQLSSDGGRMENNALSFIYGNFIEELFTAMNPFAKTDPYTEISCVMLLADIENGLITAMPGIAMQTDKMKIVSEGRIDLHTEKLEFNFKTAPRSKISFSAGEVLNPYIKVVGTLAKPRLTLAPVSAAVSGGAAVATFGLSILAKGVWDRIFSASDPCAEVVKQAEKNRQKKDSQN